MESKTALDAATFAYAGTFGLQGKDYDTEEPGRSALYATVPAVVSSHHQWRYSLRGETRLRTKYCCPIWSQQDNRSSSHQMPTGDGHGNDNTTKGHLCGVSYNLRCMQLFHYQRSLLQLFVVMDTGD